MTYEASDLGNPVFHAKAMLYALLCALLDKHQIRADSEIL
jgi:hypothetical protein